MKKLLLSLALATITGIALGQDPSRAQGQLTTTTRTTTTTTTGGVSTQLPKPRSPRAVPLVPSEGVVQAAVRTGKPLQMVNPAAPAQYGSGQEHASHDPKDPGKPKGIVLFAWTF